ncbi:MAG: hypothetical protein QXU18_11860 [Thermoplasmatales archaeon]
MGEVATTEFLFRSLKRFNIHDATTITTDRYQYRNALVAISRTIGIYVKRQICLFHIFQGYVREDS